MMKTLTGSGGVSHPETIKMTGTAIQEFLINFSELINLDFKPK